MPFNEKYNNGKPIKWSELHERFHNLPKGSGEFYNDPVGNPEYDPKTAENSPLDFYSNVGQSRGYIISKRNPYKRKS